MNQTTNLGLNKPESTDALSVDAFNQNADKLDTVIKSLQTNKIGDIIVAAKAPDDTWLPCDGQTVPFDNCEDYLHDKQVSIENASPEYRQFGGKFINYGVKVDTHPALIGDVAVGPDDIQANYNTITNNTIVYSDDNFLTTKYTDATASNNIFFCDGYWFSVASNKIYYKQNVESAWTTIDFNGFSIDRVDGIYTNGAWCNESYDAGGTTAWARVKKYYLFGICGSTVSHIGCIEVKVGERNSATLLWRTMLNINSNDSVYYRTPIIRMLNNHLYGDITYGDDQYIYHHFISTKNNYFYTYVHATKENIPIVTPFSDIIQSNIKKLTRGIGTTVFDNDRSNIHTIIPGYINGKLAIVEIGEQNYVEIPIINVAENDSCIIVPYMKKFLIIVGNGSELKAYLLNQNSQATSLLNALQPHVASIKKIPIETFYNDTTLTTKTLVPTLAGYPFCWMDKFGVYVATHFKQGSTAHLGYVRFNYGSTPPINNVIGEPVFWVKVKD